MGYTGVTDSGPDGAAVSAAERQVDPALANGILIPGLPPNFIPGGEPNLGLGVVNKPLGPGSKPGPGGPKPGLGVQKPGPGESWK